MLLNKIKGKYFSAINHDCVLLFASFIIVLKKKNLTFLELHNISVPPARQNDYVSYALLLSKATLQKIIATKGNYGTNSFMTV